MQKLVGKDWNVEMHVSPSREAIHGRQPRRQAGRRSSTQRACPVHRQACPVHKQAGQVHRGHAKFTGRQVKYREGMPSTRYTASMPSTQAGMPSTQVGMPRQAVHESSSAKKQLSRRVVERPGKKVYRQAAVLTGKPTDVTPNRQALHYFTATQEGNLKQLY
jgi:hypothetical protein